MKTRIVCFLAIFLCVGLTAPAQLTIEDCYEKARLNYPQIKLYNLLGESKEYNLQNASRGYLPQVSLAAKATYQSEVTKIPISIPGITIPTINKDQYQAVVEVNQVIWDGGAIQSQKKRIEADYEMEQSQYEVDMYALHERINDIFFGILVIDEQLALTHLYNEELKTHYDKVTNLMRNGTANQADLDAVSVEILNTSQRRTELEAMKRSYADMLAYFIGEPSGGESLRIRKPQISSYTSFYDGALSGNDAWGTRPEISFYEAHIKQLEVQKEAVTAGNRPRLSAFIQGGYGNPGLNMLRDEFRPYALGGVKLSWNFGSFYTRKNDLKKINNAIDRIELQQDVFNFNTRIKTIRQHAEIDKYFKIIKDDDDIIRLRENIKKSSEAKVENGTMSVNDLVRDITAEQTARRNKALHETEMIKAIYQLKNTLNK